MFIAKLNYKYHIFKCKPLYATGQWGYNIIKYISVVIMYIYIYIYICNCRVAQLAKASGTQAVGRGFVKLRLNIIFRSDLI